MFVYVYTHIYMYTFNIHMHTLRMYMSTIKTHYMKYECGYLCVENMSVAMCVCAMCARAYVCIYVCMLMCVCTTSRYIPQHTDM